MLRLLLFVAQSRLPTHGMALWDVVIRDVKLSAVGKRMMEVDKCMNDNQTQGPPGTVYILLTHVRLQVGTKAFQQPAA